MKCLVVLVAVLAVSSAQFNGFTKQARRSAFQQAPRPVARVSRSDAAANIVRYDNDINPDGSYSFLFETDNGITAQQQGAVRSSGSNSPVEAVVAQGSYSYTSPEGEPISVQYTADENGYQPSSNILPVGPPIPPQILRSIEYIAKYNAKNAPQQQQRRF